MITSYIPDIAKADVLVITKDDVMKRGLAVDTVDLVEPLYTGETHEMVVARSGLKALFNELNIEGDPGANISDMTMHHITLNLLQHNAAAQPFDFNRDGKNDFGIILAPDMDATPSENAGLITGFPSDVIFAKAGTQEERIAMIMWHEAQHIAQPSLLMNSSDKGYDRYPLAYEVDADRGAINTYLQAIEDGHKLNPEYLKSFKEERMVGSLGAAGSDMDFFFHYGGISSIVKGNYGISSHSTDFGIDENGNHPGMNDAAIPNSDSRSQFMAMLTVNTAISGLVGTDYIVNTAASEMENTGALSKRSLEYFGEHDFLTVMLSPQRHGDVGQQICDEQPVRALAAGQALIDAGFIKTDSPEGEYIAGIQNYFKENGDRITGDPAYQGALAHYTSMIQAGLSPNPKGSFERDYAPEIGQMETQRHWVDHKMEIFYGNIYTAALDAKDEVSIEKLDKAWMEYNGVGKDGKDRMEGSGKIAIADQYADSARTMMGNILEIAEKNPSLILSYKDNDGVAGGNLFNRIISFGEDANSLKSAVDELEKDAVTNDKIRTGYGFNKTVGVEFGPG